MKNIIEFVHVSKKYQVGTQEIEAVKDVSFSIKPGEFGASGAGKSTVLNLLGGMDNVSEGEIIVEGKILLIFLKKKWRNTVQKK